MAITEVNGPVHERSLTYYILVSYLAHEISHHITCMLTCVIRLIIISATLVAISLVHNNVIIKSMKALEHACKQTI